MVNFILPIIKSFSKNIHLLKYSASKLVSFLSHQDSDIYELGILTLELEIKVDMQNFHLTTDGK